MRRSFLLLPIAKQHPPQAPSHLNDIVSSLTLDVDACTLYLGTVDGTLLMYKLLPPRFDENPVDSEDRENVGTCDAELQARKSIAKKPLVSLRALPFGRRIVALCDGVVLLCDRRTFDVAPLPCKLCTCIARDTSSRGDLPDKLAVACKKKIMLFTVTPVSKADAPPTPGSLPGVTLMAELPCADAVIELIWQGSFMVYATKARTYVLVDVRAPQEATPLFSIPDDSRSQPLLAGLPLVCQAILLMDTVGVVTDMQGQPSGGSLLFSGAPCAMAQGPLHVLAVVGSTVEVYDRGTSELVQSLPLPLPSPSPSKEPAPIKMVADDDGQRVVVAAGNALWCLMPVDVTSQIMELLRQKLFEDAIHLAEQAVTTGLADEADIAKSLLAAGTERQGRPTSTGLAAAAASGGAGMHAGGPAAVPHVSLLNGLMAEAGFVSFHDLDFPRAFDHFQRCLAVEPAELFPFFPKLTRWWRKRVPAKRYLGMHPPPRPIEEVVQSGLLAMRAGLVLWASEAEYTLSDDSQTLAISSAASAASTGSSTAGSAGAHASKSTGMGGNRVGDAVAGLPASASHYRWETEGQLVAYHVRRGQRAMADYLQAVRTQPGRVLDDDQKKGVDLLLAMLLTELNEYSRLEALLSSPDNACTVPELEPVLAAAGCHVALARLLEAKGDVRRALDTWRRLAEAPPAPHHLAGAVEAASSAGHATALSGSPRVLPSGTTAGLEGGYGVEGGGALGSGGMAVDVRTPPRPISDDGRGRVPGQLVVSSAEALREMQRVLEAAKDGAVVLEYGEWLLKKGLAEAAIQVFTSKQHRSRLKPDQVLPLVRPLGDDLTSRYLEHLIEGDPQEPRHHTELALALVNGTLAHLRTSPFATASLDSTGFDEAERPVEVISHATGGVYHHTEGDRELRGGPVDGAASPSDRGKALVQGSASGELSAPAGRVGGSMRQRLLRFLRAPSARYDVATVLAAVKGSQLYWEQVILYGKARDHPSALFVLAILLGDHAAADRYCEEHEGGDVYMDLLHVYLKPPPGTPAQFERALHLIERRGNQMHPLRVLEVGGLFIAMRGEFLASQSWE
eukprot:jgi/Mesvir1/11655/Mv00054-RA.2